jgi:hypothetical protein
MSLSSTILTHLYTEDKDIRIEGDVFENTPSIGVCNRYGVFELRIFLHGATESEMEAIVAAFNKPFERMRAEKQEERVAA